MRTSSIWSQSELDRAGGSRLVLVLTRKARQSIMIGDDVEVMILSSDHTKVRIGIRAPASVPVHRTEIYLEIQAEGSPERAPAVGLD
jgi:carbon storage regulator